MRNVLLAATFALAGCASPEAAMYTLRTVPGVAASGGPSPVEIRRPGLAGYLDRPEIVRDSSDYRLRLNSNERWGEPLGDMLGRVLAGDLAQRLPGVSVFTEAGSITADPAATIELDIQRFDLDADNTVVLLAQADVQRGRAHEPGATRSIRLSLPASGTTTSALVATEAQLVGQLADALASDLRRLPVPAPTPTASRRR
jgi:uncharacterized lipoprotein YmbA